MIEEQNIQDIEQVRAEYYRLSAEADKRFESKKQEFIQEIQEIPVSDPTDNPTRVETQTLFNDIVDFVQSQFAVINEMGTKANGLTIEVWLTHEALILMLKAIKAAFEAKINKYTQCRENENETTKETAKANILKQHPNAKIDWDNQSTIQIMYKATAIRKELLCNDWLGFIDWQIETVQSWLKLNEQNLDTMFDTIIKKNNALQVELYRLENEFYKNTDKQTLEKKLAPMVILVKRNVIEHRQFGYDTEQGELHLEHLKLLVEAGIDTPPTAAVKPPTVEQIIIPDNVLQALQQAGFIENAAARPLKWLKSKSLLAYFVEVANDKLNLKHGLKRQIKPFETLFNSKGITRAINDYKKIGNLPIEHKAIDNLFK